MKYLLLLSTLEIVLICAMVIIFACIIGFYMTGKIVFNLTLKRNNFIGRGIGRKFKRMAKVYKIDYKWWNKFPNEVLDLEVDEELTLYARILRQASSSDKVAIVVHGFMSNYKDMQTYCKYFYDREYNVIAVDNRAHGMSQGETVGMGWKDRIDLLKWIDVAIDIFGKNCQIVLFGLSMGAATVCMASGEDLPQNVKCIISDSAYDNVYNVFQHVMVKQLKFPGKTIAGTFEAYVKFWNGESLKKQSTIDQVKKTKTPILVIHGTGDDFVPYEMSNNIYEAIPADLRDRFTVENAWHGEAQAKNVSAYNTKLTQFITKYIKEKK